MEYYEILVAETCFDSIEDKSCDTALRTQRKVSCNNPTTAGCCAARLFYFSFKKLLDSSAAMGLTSGEPGIYCDPKNFMQMLITSSSTHFRTRASRRGPYVGHEKSCANNYDEPALPFLP